MCTAFFICRCANDNGTAYAQLGISHVKFMVENLSRDTDDQQ